MEEDIVVDMEAMEVMEEDMEVDMEVGTVEVTMVKDLQSLVMEEVMEVDMDMVEDTA